MQKVNYYLTEQQIARLQKLAKKTGLTLSELIRRAIDAFLKQEE